MLIEVDGTERIARIATSQPVEHAPGAEVLLNWVGDTPVVVGLLRLPGANTTGDTVEIDADKVMIHAKRELVLRCGKGWIRLTRDGRIVIDGVDLVSRAKRSNRVRGGSINLN